MGRSSGGVGQEMLGHGGVSVEHRRSYCTESLVIQSRLLLIFNELFFVSPMGGNLAHFR